MRPQTLPARVKVGALTYRVTEKRSEVDAYILSERSELLGVTDTKNQVIGIDPEQGDDCKADTLLHEVLHCVLNNAGVYDQGKEKFTAEEFVRRTTPGLLDTLRRNPKLVSFLLGAG